LSKELETAAYEWRYVDWENGHTVLRHNEPENNFDVELELVDELVRRKDVEQLIEDRIDYVYEEEHNADISQERACVEILEKLLEDVQNE